ncbi:MAG TPA: tRNA (adenosine(37)-N6)-threonylcarbamoyltransferase complex dimerization subunit type 1 TsaB [Verrucomicrobiae bacterium]|nr:tRNA (adenosine(37)-N6)-threonylcarbamoyltransferase complex dimerization subunit type 1 TsaB [Verrucomicrobiae bacterium]
MLFLVTDTSGRQGSVALARAKDDRVKVIESAPLTGGTFSAQLVPQVAGLLQKHGLDKKEIGALIVISGPGSFTGLRVGLAAIKALAEILRKPIVPVSLLEVLAVESASEGTVLAALDAGRGEVYVGEYSVSDGKARRVREELLPKARFLPEAREIRIATPSDELAALARDAGFTVSPKALVGTGATAAIGWKKLQAGESVPPEQLDANYIRRSDAEIFSRPGA